MKSSEARIVTLSSTGHKLSGIQWEDVHFEESYDKWKAYGQSKTAASLLAVEISERMKDEGIKTYSVHPGGIFTPLQRHLEKEEMIALGNGGCRACFYSHSIVAGGLLEISMKSIS